MKKPFFFNDQYVFSDDLNYLNDTKEEELTSRIQGLLNTSGGIFGNLTYATGSIVSGGVFGSPADYLQNKNLRPHKQTSSTIRIYSGKALDVNGELIEILDTPLNYRDVTLGNSTSYYSWLGSANVQNYIKIRYLQTSGSVQSDDEGNSYFTRYDGGFFITVNSVVPTSEEILLGTFTGDGSGAISGVITDRRLYIRPIVPASGVILDPTTKPISSWTSVEDHVNAKGSGTQTSTNPHGLTAADVGATGVQDHRIDNHVSGIIATDGVYDSGVYGSFTPTPTDTGGPSIISFSAPASNAGIAVGGEVFTAAIPDVDLTDSSIFASGDVNYYVYLNASGSIEAQAGTTGLVTPSKYVLCSITREDGGSDFSNFVDRRTYFANTPSIIRADFIEGVSNPATTLPLEASLVTTLDRIRYQLSKAINGTTTAWNSASPPLTAGGLSNADAYHTHTRSAGTSFTINYNGTDSLPAYLRFHKGSSQYASLGWFSNFFFLWKTEGTEFGNLILNDVVVSGNSVIFATTGSVVPTLQWDNDGKFGAFEHVSNGLYADLKAKTLLLQPNEASVEVDIEFGQNRRTIRHFYGDANNRGFRFLSTNTPGNTSYEDIYVGSIFASGNLEVGGSVSVGSEEITEAKIAQWDTVADTLFTSTGAVIHTEAVTQNNTSRYWYQNTHSTPSMLIAKGKLQTVSGYGTHLGLTFVPASGSVAATLLEEAMISTQRGTGVVLNPAITLNIIVPPSAWVEVYMHAPSIIDSDSDFTIYEIY